MLYITIFLFLSGMKNKVHFVNVNQLHHVKGFGGKWPILGQLLKASFFH